MRAPLQITRIQSQFKLLENTNTQHSWDRGHPPSSRYRFPRTCTCVILHGSRTGTDEYFIVRSRNGVITFLWFLFLPLHVHVSSYTQHAYIYIYVLPRFTTLDLIVALAIFEEKTSWSNFRNLVTATPRFRFFSMEGKSCWGVVEGGRLKGDDDGRTFRMHGRKVLAKLFDRDSTVLWRWGREY